MTATASPVTNPSWPSPLRPREDLLELVDHEDQGGVVRGQAATDAAQDPSLVCAQLLDERGGGLTAIRSNAASSAS